MGLANACASGVWERLPARRVPVSSALLRAALRLSGGWAGGPERDPVLRTGPRKTGRSIQPNGLAMEMSGPQSESPRQAEQGWQAGLGDCGVRELKGVRRGIILAVRRDVRKEHAVNQNQPQETDWTERFPPTKRPKENTFVFVTHLYFP